jgi:hypothetical protein
MMQPLRDAFLLQIPDHVDSLARVAKARELLQFLATTTPDTGPYGNMIRLWSERLSTLPDDYIAHEFLEETNSPSTVRDFASAAARHGLGYLGECELSSMILDNYGSQLADQVRARSGDDLIASEQYLDLLSGRTFRQSILVASERMGGVNRALTPARVEGLHFLAPAGLTVEQKGKNFRVTDSSGRTLSSESKAVSKGIKQLTTRFPASTTFDEAAQGLDPAGREQLREALYQMVIAGMMPVLSEPVSATNMVSEKPVAIKLARVDATNGEPLTTNLRHETDGTKGHSELEEILKIAALKGDLNFFRDGQLISVDSEINSVAKDYLPTLLSNLAQTALLEG